MTESAKPSESKGDRRTFLKVGAGVVGGAVVAGVASIAYYNGVIGSNNSSSSSTVSSLQDELSTTQSQLTDTQGSLSTAQSTISALNSQLERYSEFTCECDRPDFHTPESGDECLGAGIVGPGCGIGSAGAGRYDDGFHHVEHDRAVAPCRDSGGYDSQRRQRSGRGRPGSSISSTGRCRATTGRAPTCTCRDHSCFPIRPGR